MAHPWFREVNLQTIRDIRAPNVPVITSELDTSNFDKYEEDEPWISKGGAKSTKKEMTFIGYTYKMDAFDEKRPLHKALEELEQSRPSHSR